MFSLDRSRTRHVLSYTSEVLYQLIYLSNYELSNF